MTFAAPWALAAAAAAAAWVLYLHLLARRRRAEPLPTTRFVPASASRATARARRPTERLLLVVRVLALLLLGIALAGPAWETARQPVARIVALDASAAAADWVAARDDAADRLRPGDVLVVFDTAARVVGGSALDSLRELEQGADHASLTAGLLAASRAGIGLADAADSLELVILSPLPAEAWDAATPMARDAWKGRITLARPAARAVPDARAMPAHALEVNDPIRPAVARIAVAGGVPQRTRLRRELPTAGDSAWATDSAGVLVVWPADAAPEPETTAGALVIGESTVVAPWRRGGRPPPGSVVARWVDGAPAATERPLGGGCIRTVAVPVPTEGDLALRESFGRAVAALLGPCGGHGDSDPLPDSLVAQIAGGGGLMETGPLARRGAAPEGRDWPVALLLGIALVLLLAELRLRREREVNA